MYVPAHFAAGDLTEIAAFVDAAAAADLVTFDGTRLVSTLLPVIWDHFVGQHGALSQRAAPQRAAPQRDAPYGRLIGHIARSNPQWSTAAPQVPALAIVHGPQAYISPSWYESSRDHGKAVPTWNYTTVHFTGPVTFRSDTGWLRDVVTRLTERHEAGRAGRWWVSDAPVKYIDEQLRAIVGVELVVERIEAKDKLSQNRPQQDRACVITRLKDEPRDGARAIAELMERREARLGSGT
jgi:transcriptional regulator